MFCSIHYIGPFFEDVRACRRVGSGTGSTFSKGKGAIFSQKLWAFLRSVERMHKKKLHVQGVHLR